MWSGWTLPTKTPEMKGILSQSAQGQTQIHEEAGASLGQDCPTQQSQLQVTLHQRQGRTQSSPSRVRGCAQSDPEGKLGSEIGPGGWLDGSGWGSPEWGFLIVPGGRRQSILPSLSCNIISCIFSAARRKATRKDPGGWRESL